MSKRAKEMALKAYPNVEQPVWDESYPKTLFVRHTERNAFVKGYEQAEKDMIEKASKWIRAHWREYILGPDADGCIGFGLWENDFRKAMEEE